MNIAKASYSSKKVTLKFSSFILLEKCVHEFLQTTHHYVYNTRRLKHCRTKRENGKSVGGLKFADQSAQGRRNM